MSPTPSTSSRIDRCPMSELVRLIVALLIGSVVGVGAYLVAEAIRRRRTQPEAESAGRRGWCQICGREVRGRALHEVRRGQDDTEISDGGTWMAAEFCPEHCPGGCLQQQQVRDRIEQARRG